jgi:hypothetical protein
MTFLKDIIKNHIESPLQTESELFYFGTLIELGEDQHSDMEIKLVKRNRRGTFRPSGYLYVNQDGQYHDVHSAGEMELYFFHIRADRLTIQVHPYQITRTVPILRQAIVKEDWVTPSPIEVRINGNYVAHMRAVERAYEAFMKSGQSELWLPSFIGF